MTNEDDGQKRVMVALISMGLTLIACGAAIAALVIALTVRAV
ncbi:MULTISPECIES: hypothetical protein [unclassified Streptomyces]|nr:hypothetical protein [Streptomyces sp. NBC_01429]